MARQAYSLDVLMREVDAHAPRRSKASDGGQASPEHSKANPDSDHEALDGVAWTARDITDDPAGGLDGSDLFHRILNLMREGHPALRSGSYLIHNRKIVSFDRLDEGLRDYDGYNAHRQHVHVSVSDARSGYDSTRPWNLWADAPVKPAAPRTPTIADCVDALKQLVETSANPTARARYADAIATLDNIDAGNHVRVLTTLSEVREVLRIKEEEEAGGLSSDQLQRIRSARDLLAKI